jgi:hypothetical protein
MYRQFNIQQFYVLPIHCICVFCVDLRTNSINWLVCLLGCLLRGTYYVFKCSSYPKSTLHCTWCVAVVVRHQNVVIPLSPLSNARSFWTSAVSVSLYSPSSSLSSLCRSLTRTFEGHSLGILRGITPPHRTPMTLSTLPLITLFVLPFALFML